MPNKEKYNFTLVIDAMPAAGAPKLCYDLINGVDKNNFQVSIVTLFFKGELGVELEEKGIPLLDLQMSRPFCLKSIFQYVPRISNFANSHGARFLHAHLLASGFYTSLVSRYMGLPAIYTAHGKLPADFFLRLLDIVVRHSYRDITAVSKNVLNELNDFSLIRKQKKHCVYNGVDTKYWSAQRDRKSRGSVSFIMVANFTREKDQMTLLKAFAILKSKYKEIKLSFVGEGVEVDMYREWVHVNKVDGVCFIGTVRDVRPYLESADIFVLSSLTEGFSMAVLEAMSMGMPVIASRVGGMDEAIVNGESGILVEANNVEMLVEAMEKVINDVNLREFLAGNACQRVKEQFSLGTMIDRYQQLFQTIVSDNNVNSYVESK